MGFLPVSAVLLLDFTPNFLDKEIFVFADSPLGNSGILVQTSKCLKVFSRVVIDGQQLTDTLTPGLWLLTHTKLLSV